MELEQPDEMAWDLYQDGGEEEGHGAKVRLKDVHAKGERGARPGAEHNNVGRVSLGERQVPTQVQTLAERAQALQHGQLQLEGQRVGVNRPSPGTDRSLADEGAGQLRQDIFAEPAP